MPLSLEVGFGLGFSLGTLNCLRGGVCLAQHFCAKYPNFSPGQSLTEKKSFPSHSFPKKARWHTMCWRWAVGGWGLVVDGGWQWLAVGGWSPLVVGGGWRLAVGGGWWLGVDGTLGRSLWAVLNQKKLSPLRNPLEKPPKQTRINSKPFPTSTQQKTKSVISLCITNETCVMPKNSFVPTTVWVNTFHAIVITSTTKCCGVLLAAHYTNNTSLHRFLHQVPWPIAVTKWGQVHTI